VSGINKVSIGKKGETLARHFFKKKGFAVIAHNFHCRFGEIDLILRKDKSIRFIEVKFRHSTDYGLPQESVKRRKQAKIRKTALLWLRLRHLPMDSEIHFDVLGIIQNQGKTIYDYIADAF
jgi:putative endonuclease